MSLSDHVKNTTIAADQEEDASSGGESWLLDHMGLVLWLGFVVVIIATVVSFWLRGACYDQCGGRECCTGTLTVRERREIQQRLRLAQATQRELERERQRQQEQSNRPHLKKHYMQVLEPFTLTLEPFHLQQDERPSSSSDDIVDLEENAEEPKTQQPTRPLPPGLALGDDCIFCLKEYQAGDQVVFSPNHNSYSNNKSQEEACLHTFHLDCMLEWLSLGKEECPICRGGFLSKQMVVVPSTRIGAADNHNAGQQQGNGNSPQEESVVIQQQGPAVGASMDAPRGE